MSRKIYISTGTTRKIKQLYIGSEDISRRIKAAYVGIEGYSKKFWPIAYLWAKYTTTEEHVWDKYSIEYTYSLQYTQKVTNTVTFEYGGTFATGYEFNEATGTYKLTGLSNVAPATPSTGSVTRYSNSWDYYTTPGKTRITIEGITDTSADARFTTIYMGRYRRHTFGVAHEAGIFSRDETESMGDHLGKVTSSASGTYPSDGISGDYWYQYAGVNTITDKYVGTVASENRSAYPDNGLSGSYWYIYQGEA